MSGWLQQQLVIGHALLSALSVACVAALTSGHLRLLGAASYTNAPLFLGTPAEDEQHQSGQRG
jgi:hypothetical protein